MPVAGKEGGAGGPGVGALRRGSRDPTKSDREAKEEAEERMQRDLADDAVWKRIQQNTFTR